MCHNILRILSHGNLPYLSVSLTVFVPFHGLLLPSELVAFYNITDAVLFASFLTGGADADRLSIHDIEKYRDLFDCIHPATSEGKISVLKRKGRIHASAPPGGHAELRNVEAVDLRFWIADEDLASAPMVIW